MIERPLPAEYVTLDCPICGRADESVLLAEVWSAGRTSLESAYCSRCEHRYFRKLPSPRGTSASTEKSGTRPRR